MVDFKALLNKPLITEEEHNKLCEKNRKEWYDALPESEKKIVDKQRSRL